MICFNKCVGWGGVWVCHVVSLSSGKTNARCFLLSLILATAELFKNEGNDKFRKKDFSNAILLYTKGIKVNCKDEELNAKLYSNRATAHFNLGEEL